MPEQPPLPRGLKVIRRHAARPTRGYRDPGSSSELVVERRLAHRGHLVGAAAWVLSAAVTGGLWVERVTLAGDVALASAPPFWIAAAVLLLWGVLLGLAATRRQRVVVRDGELRVRGPRERTFSRDEIDQLFLEGTPGHPHQVRLMAQLVAGPRVLLVPALPSPSQGRFLEGAIEEALGLDDRPVENELPRAPAADDPSPPARRRTMGASVLLGALVSALPLGARACGTPIGAVDVDLGGGEAHTRLHLDEPHTVSVIGDAALAGEALSGRNVSLDDLPALPLRIEAADQGLVCDPFDVFIRTSARNTSRHHWSFEGPIEGCSLSLPAGTTTLRVVLDGALPTNVEVRQLRLIFER